MKAFCIARLSVCRFTGVCLHTLQKYYRVGRGYMCIHTCTQCTCKGVHIIMYTRICKIVGIMGRSELK